MDEEGLSPKEAAIKSMEEVSGPVVAVALVLASVFIPIAFLGGMTGVMYKQFSVTIAVSVLISALVALTLTPSLCALIIKRRTKKKNRTVSSNGSTIFPENYRYLSGGGSFLP